jgi:predicted NAD/FAD-dependent oxidoreductase
VTSTPIAIVGAGLAGIACARRLQSAGVPVRLFDKGSAPGGRIATRRREDSAFDHGAQYWTVREPAFEAAVEAAVRQGRASRWSPRWPGGEQETRTLWVGAPAMASMPAALAAGLDLSLRCRITSLLPDGPAWRLSDDLGASHGPFALVVLAMPAPQAGMLAAAATPLAARVATVPMAPCWAAMLAFESPLDLPVDADWREDPVLPWVARNSAKPGRRGLDAWVLHAGAEWSRARLEASPAAVQAELVQRFEQRAGRPLPPLAHGSAHRWRYARVEAPAGEPWLADWDAGLAFCGDWCLDARIEAAFLSGDALGEALAARCAR